MMGKQDQRRDELLYFLHELTRDLSRQDRLENASFFDWDREQGNPAGDWNNDTVVYALELIIRDWVYAHWGKLFDPYVKPGKGLVPPEMDLIEATGIPLDESDHEPF